MADLIGGPINGATDAEMADTDGPSVVQTTFGEGLSAAASNAWQDVSMNVFSRSTKALEAAQAHFNQPGDADTQEMEAERGPGPDTTQLPPEIANTKAKEAGATLTPFTAPVSQGSLDAYIHENLTKQKNADVIARTANGITGTVSRFGVGALVSLADPLNDMAMMIPGAPEAWTARAVEELGGGLLARTAVHAASGAFQGAAGMAAMQPFQYAAANQDHEDYGWGDALRQVAFGALLGAGGGALHGVLSRSPETTEAVAKASLARVMTDDPRGVDVGAILDHGEAEASTAPPPASDVPVEDRAGPSARAMATRAMNKTDPELDQATRANAATIDTAPKLEGEPSKDVAAVNQMLADTKAEYDAHVAAGRIVESPTLAEAGKDELALGKAHIDYAAICGLGA